MAPRFVLKGAANAGGWGGGGAKKIEQDKNMDRKKTYVEDIERALYDIRDISARKNDPPWMLEFRLKSLEVYNSLELPTWGPDISALDMNRIVTYVKPNADIATTWDDLPSDIKNTFDRPGIPEAEKKSLIYDSVIRGGNR